MVNLFQHRMMYDAIYQARYGEFISASHDGTIGNIERSVVHLDKAGKYSEQMLQLLGASYILHRVSDGRHVWAYPFWEYPYYERIYNDEKYEVFKNTQALPRAFLASSYVLETEKQKILSRLFSPDIDRSTTLLLETKPERDPQIGTGSAKIISYSPNRVTLSTHSESPKLLFLSDVYDEGWLASVNGVQTPILRANYAFRAIALPAGDNQVEFVYQPWEITYGLYGTFISFFVLLGLSMRKLMYDHRHLHTIS